MDEVATGAWLGRTTGRGTIEVMADERAGLPLEPHEVRLDVRAVALNFRDLYFVRGNQFREPIAGRVPFSDCVATVTAVGADVTRWTVGDRVTTTALPAWTDGPLTAAKFEGAFGSRERDGVFRSHLIVDEHEIVASPDHLTDVQAATLPIAGITAWHALGIAPTVGPGSVVLVQTTGGVALFAVQFALALGADVIVVSRSSEKLAQVAQLGSVRTVDSGQHPDWDDTVLAMTDGRGVDLTLDMGLTGGLARSVRATAFEGTVAIIGVVQEESTELPIFTVMNKNLTVQGVETGSVAMFKAMNDFVTAHRIEPLVDSVFGFDDYDRALDRLGEAPFGKVVLTDVANG